MFLNPSLSASMITGKISFVLAMSCRMSGRRICRRGCFLNPGGKFALVGTTVAPGFEFADFELANRERLLKQYPAQKNLILCLTDHYPRTTAGPCTEASHKG